MGWSWEIKNEQKSYKFNWQVVADVLSWQFVADVMYHGDITKLIDDMKKSYENAIIKNNIRLARKLVKSLDEAKAERAQNGKDN